MVHFVVYSPKYNIIGIFSPKSGCTLTRQLWYKIHENEMIQDEPTNLWHRITEDFPVPPSFPVRGYMIVRDVYKRVISMYTNRLVAKRDWTTPFRDGYFMVMRNTNYTFRNFCKYLKLLKKNKWRHVDIHYLPQSYIPKHFKSCINMKKIKVIKLEKDLSVELKNFYNDIEVSKIIDEFFKERVWINDTNRNSFKNSEFMVDINMKDWEIFPSYDQFMHPDCIKMINKIYKEDFELYNYPML